MRHASLRVKINFAIFLAFFVAATAFGLILTRYMGNRQLATQNRARMLLAALAAHRLESLAPLLDKQEQLVAARGILDRVTAMDGVDEAALYDAAGRLLVFSGPHAAPVLHGGPGQPLPQGRLFTIAASPGDGHLFAALLEPIKNPEGHNLGYLRLSYSLGDITDLNRQTWTVFVLAVIAAYLLLALLLNILLHRFVLSPVDILRRGLEAVQAGQLGHSVPVRSGDAMGRMATAFNAMSATLKETSDSLIKSRNELEEHRQRLADRVAERTTALARANARLTAEIGARREAEDRVQRALALHQAILESTAEGMACVCPPMPGELLACNRRFLELWEMPGDWPQLPNTERMLLMLDKLVDPEAALAGYEALMADHNRLDSGTIPLRDGRFFERRSGPIFQGANCIGRVFSYVDVTEERKRQARTEREKNLAEDASKAKGTFLAVMSHEIRTPLNVVIGLTEELLAGAVAREQREHLHMIQHAATHLLGVVSDVLDFSKIEAGKLVLERIDFNIQELVAGVAGVFAHEARSKGLAFTATVDAGVPEFLCGDPGRLRQVLLNLLGNAVKFTETGAVSLTVSPTAPAETPADRIGVRIRVTDSGIGIDPERLDRLFGDFQQGGGSIARRFGGTGLGLAICKGIVTRMGGAIVVDSTPGSGSTFTCTAYFLPGRTVATETAGHDPNPASGPQRLHILLVEDNALNAAVTQLHLTRMGHELTVATSAAEAYALLAQERFHSVLMDIEMPEVDGISATRVIRAGGPPERPVLDPDVPIIAVTAHAIEDVRQKCLEAGMTGFVTKPVNFQTLRRLLEHTDDSPPPAPTPPVMENADLFDPAGARKTMDIAWEHYQELAVVSFREGSQRLSELTTAMAAGDLDRAIIAAHTIKGAAATMGAPSSRRTAAEVEKALRQGNMPAAGQGLVTLTALWEALGKAFAGWRPPGGE